MRFWDSSAIAATVVADPQRDALLALLEDDPGILAWWATSVECASALARLEREDALTAAQAQEFLDRLRHVAASWTEVQPSGAVRTTAMRMLRVHPLRAADSLQLAAAFVASRHDPPTLDFVTLDGRLGEAAMREGFRLVAI